MIPGRAGPSTLAASVTFAARQGSGLATVWVTGFICARHVAALVYVPEAVDEALCQQGRLGLGLALLPCLLSVVMRRLPSCQVSRRPRAPRKQTIRRCHLCACLNHDTWSHRTLHLCRLRHSRRQTGLGPCNCLGSRVLFIRGMCLRLWMKHFASKADWGLD